MTETNRNPTNIYQKEIRRTINECNKSFNNSNKWKYVNLKPEAPKIRGLIKIHKPGMPIRPIVNFINAPSYKLAKLLTNKLKTHIPLPNVYNIKNSTHLIEELNNIPVNSNIKLASFDITNMYTNIPTEELVQIIIKMYKSYGVDTATTLELEKNR
jgi:hypothetical protein